MFSQFQTSTKKAEKTLHEKNEKNDYMPSSREDAISRGFEELRQIAQFAQS